MSTYVKNRFRDRFIQITLLHVVGVIQLQFLMNHSKLLLDEFPSYMNYIEIFSYGLAGMIGFNMISSMIFMLFLSEEERDSSFEVYSIGQTINLVASVILVVFALNYLVGTLLRLLY